MKLQGILILFFLPFFAHKAHSQSEKEIMNRSIQHQENSDRYINAHLWDSAQTSLKLLSKIAEDYPTEFTRGLNKLQHGIYSKRLSNYEKSVDQLNKAYDHFLAEKNDTLMGIALNHLGEVYRILDLKEMSLRSYRRSLRYMEKTDNYRQQSFTLSNLANYFKKNKLLDSAKYYYKRSLELKKTHNIAGKGKTLNNLAGVYYLMDDYETSKNMYLEAISEAKSENDSSFISYPMIELAVIDIEKSNFDQAKYVLNEVSKITLDAKSQLRFYEVMAYYSEEKADFQGALSWKDKYIRFYRQQLNERQTRNIQDLSVRYETERKNLEIESKNLKIAVQEQSISLKNTQVIFLVVGVLGIICITFILTRGILRRNKIETLQARFDGEKSIKTSIGKNLHDFIAPELTSARMKLELIQMKNSSSELTSVVDQLQESSENIRNMSHQLSPMIYRLKVSTFREIIKNALLEFERYNKIKVVLNLPFSTSVDTLPERDQENIYGIILEGLNNVRRHSKADTLNFSLMDVSNDIQLKIEDNGIGIPESTNNGIGIENMKSRANLLKGILTIETVENGSLLQLNFPKR